MYNSLVKYTFVRSVSIFALSSVGILYGLGEAFAAPVAPKAPTTQKTAPLPSTTLVDQKEIQKKKSIEEVNTLIIDSYRTRLDRVLDTLYANIRLASRGNIDLQIESLTQVQADLDEKLDLLNNSEMSDNRKKILLGVYFYLKSNIEEEVSRLKGGEK